MKKASKRDRTRAASKSATPDSEINEMRPEYDFRGGVRGKYADRFAPRESVRVVVLAPDVAAGFRSSRAVNAALRKLLRERDEARAPARRSVRAG